MSGPRWQDLLRHVPVALAGRPLHDDARHRPFFIVGSPRSGTTLLRAILQAHPAVHIPPETHVLPSVVRVWRWYCRVLAWSDLVRVVLARFEFMENWDVFDLPLGPLSRQLTAAPPRARNLAFVLDALYRAHAARHKPAVERWGDKTPNYALALPDLRTVFPDLRAIHVLRDGRDVVRSHMRLAPYTLAQGSHRWLRAVRAARAFGQRHPAQFLEVRYEDLVRDPKPAIERVTAFVDIPFDAALLRHHEADLKLRDTDRWPITRYVMEPIHDREVGRWREYFNEDQVEELERLLAPTLGDLGYGRDR